MTAIAGRKSLVKVCATSGGAFAICLGVQSITSNRTRDLIDVSDFGPDWKANLTGLKDATFEITGNYRSDDTTGQGLVHAAFDDDDDLFIQYLPDGTNGWQAQVHITKDNVDSGTTKQVSWTATLNQTGGLTVVP
jgi:predicted secreted protein